MIEQVLLVSLGLIFVMAVIVGVLRAILQVRVLVQDKEMVLLKIIFIVAIPFIFVWPAGFEKNEIIYKKGKKYAVINVFLYLMFWMLLPLLLINL